MKKWRWRITTKAAAPLQPCSDDKKKMSEQNIGPQDVTKPRQSAPEHSVHKGT